LTTGGNSRNPVRDRLLILMAFRHALRVSELVDIRWLQIDLDTATIHIRRAKNGTPGIHGLQGDELRLLRASSPSSRRSAARMSASRIVWPMPGISRKAGQDSTANMSDAQDDKMIRFSGAESSLSLRTSSGDA
jgi:integrase